MQDGCQRTFSGRTEQVKHHLATHTNANWKKIIVFLCLAQSTSQYISIFSILDLDSSVCFALYLQNKRFFLFIDLSKD